jgi:hypothetical protein
MKYQLTEHVRVTNGSREAVLLDLRNGHYFTTNELGATILRGLSEGKSAAEIATSIASTFNVEITRASADLGAFLDRLQVRQLVKVCE